LNWYSEHFHDPDLWEALGRSLVIAFCTGLITTFIGLWGALALHQWSFKFRPILQALSLVSLIIPELVLALSLLSWFSVLHFQLNLWTVVIAHVTLTLPFATLVMGARLQNFDNSLFEAAKDLGATSNQIVLKVTLPILKPSLIAAFLLSFLLSFDDFLVTFFTNGVGGDTLPIKLYTQMKIGLSPKLSALSSVMLLASSLLILVLFRFRGFELFKNKE
ncbi:MAG: ABC transporter permease, partial [Pseudobdellovibrionaceae bacterium]